MVRNRIKIDNEVYEPRVSPPRSADVLKLSDQERENIKLVKMLTTESHSEEGSDYSSFVQKVKSEEDVIKGLYKLRIRFGDATHISCGYRLESAFGPYRQEAIDDKEYGAGRAILKVLKERAMENVCVYVVRWYGGVRLGPRRFKILDMLTKSALAAYSIKINERMTRMQRSLSQTSLDSFTSNRSQMDMSFTTIDSQAEEEENPQQLQENSGETEQKEDLPEKSSSP